MSYTNYYLKFDNEEQFKTFHDPENNLAINANAVKIVGNVYIPTGTMLTDDEGNEYPEKKPSEGYYVNIRTKTDLPTELSSFVFTPAADFPIPRWATDTATPVNEPVVKVPKGDLLAMISIDSIANIIKWMGSEGDNNAIAFKAFYDSHDQFKVQDPTFKSLMGLLYSLALITEAEFQKLISLF